MKRKDLKDFRNTAVSKMTDEQDYSTKQIYFAIVLTVNHMLRNKIESGAINFPGGKGAIFCNANSSENITEYNPKIPPKELEYILKTIKEELKQFKDVSISLDGYSIFFS